MTNDQIKDRLNNAGIYTWCSVLIPGNINASGINEHWTALLAPADTVTISTVESVLREHWLVDIGWDHKAKTDTPICNCRAVRLGTHRSMGAARDAWISHVIEALCQALEVKRDEPGER